MIRPLLLLYTFCEKCISMVIYGNILCVLIILVFYKVFMKLDKLKHVSINHKQWVLSI